MGNILKKREKMYLKINNYSPRVEITQRMSSWLRELMMFLKTEKILRGSTEYFTKKLVPFNKLFWESTPPPFYLLRVFLYVLFIYFGGLLVFGVVVLGWDSVGGNFEKTKLFNSVMSLNTFNVSCSEIIIIITIKIK